MMQETLAKVWARAIALWQRGRTSFSKLPRKTQIVVASSAGLVLLVVVYAGWGGSKDSVLHLKVQHSFRTARIEVSVDGSTVYSGKLYGSPHKKFGLFSDGVWGSMSQSIPVPSGKHVVVVNVAGDDGTVHEDSITGLFARNNTRELSVFARHSNVDLTWQGGGSTVGEVPAPAEPAPPPTGMTRYATTILLSVMGSIVSALTGLAIRELPGKIRARQAAAVEEKPQAHSAAAGS